MKFTRTILAACLVFAPITGHTETDVPEYVQIDIADYLQHAKELAAAHARVAITGTYEIGSLRYPGPPGALDHLERMQWIAPPGHPFDAYVELYAWPLQQARELDGWGRVVDVCGGVAFVTWRAPCTVTIRGEVQVCSHKTFFGLGDERKQVAETERPCLYLESFQWLEE